MKVLAINGSPRKTWNTADMLEAALEVAAAQGAETEYIHLYDYNCKGCRSCFACKRIGSPSLGKCAVQDDLTPILEKILAADVVLFGQPIYFGHISSGMWTLLERLWFAGMNYDSTYSTNYPKNVVCGMIFTMNSPDDTFYDALITHLCGNMSRLVGQLNISQSPTPSNLTTMIIIFPAHSMPRLKPSGTKTSIQSKRPSFRPGSLS